MSDLLTYLIAGLLGILFQIFVMKIPRLQQLSKVANHPFSFKEYLKDDWHAIAGSLVTVCIAIIGIDEIINLKPIIAKYLIFFFFFMGGAGSAVIQLLFSVATKKVMQIIDVKTNIADGKVPPVDSGNVDGAKEIVKDRAKNEVDSLNKEIDDLK